VRVQNKEKLKVSTARSYSSTMYAHSNFMKAVLCL
jgi:hypothetical protein